MSLHRMNKRIYDFNFMYRNLVSILAVRLIRRLTPVSQIKESRRLSINLRV